MFERYRNRLDVLGDSFDKVAKKNARNLLNYAFNHTSSFQKVYINNKPVEVRLVTDSSTTVKSGTGSTRVIFRDGVYYPAGTYIDIPDPQQKNKLYKWMIIYTADDLLFEKPIIKKCNYLLKWVNDKGNLVERWCVFADNFRLANGDRSVAKDRMTIPYNMFSLTLPYDMETINLRRDDRFLIDDSRVIDNPDAYIITNRNIFSKSFDDSFDGVIELSVSQHQFNPLTDNKELMVADYNKLKTKNTSSEALPVNTNIKLNYSNKNNILKMGSNFKTITAECYLDDILQPNIDIEWRIDNIAELNPYIETLIDGNILKIKCKYNSSIIGRSIKIAAISTDGLYNGNLVLKVVSAI